MTRAEADLLTELEERLRFETLLADISARFVNLPADQIDNEIEEAQRDVCECLGLDLSSLWQFPAENQPLLTLSHLYRPLEARRFPSPWMRRSIFPGPWSNL